MPALVDTSVWIEHLRTPDPVLVSLLEDDQATVHPFVIGELACGRLDRRDEVLSLLGRLRGAPMADHHEALLLVEEHRLWGGGLGWIDAHLLASCRIGSLRLLTRDRRLREAAEKLGVAFD